MTKQHSGFQHGHALFQLGVYLIHTGLQPGDEQQALAENRFNGFRDICDYDR